MAGPTRQAFPRPRIAGAFRRGCARAAVAAAALACAVPATAATAEFMYRAPVASGDRIDHIDVTVFRPEGAGPFPVVVLSHGSPRSADERRRAGRQRMAAQSRVFVEMGFAVLVPTRRGYGESGGEWAEAYGTCTDPDYFTAGLESARDLRAAVDAVRREPWADTSRVVLAGQSAGGWASVAAASQPFQGLVAVVNFAGGRGSLGPNEVCGESRLVEAMARYGSQARVPALFVYSVNDLFFGPSLARRMFAAFTGSGARADFVQAPPQVGDGHGYFARAMRDWSPRVARFLRKLGALPPRE